MNATLPEHFDDLSPKEDEFRRLLEHPSEYAKWARGVVKAWNVTPAGLRAALALRGGK